MEVHIEERVPQPVLGIRRPATLTSIPQEIGAMMPTLMRIAGPHVSGLVVARYLNWEDDEGLLELAVPVTAQARPSDDVRAATLPGGRCAVVEHRGSYDGLHATWESLRTWLADNGHKCRDDGWEEYVNDCAVTPPADLVTRIVWPIS